MNNDQRRIRRGRGELAGGASRAGRDRPCNDRYVGQVYGLAAPGVATGPSFVPTHPASVGGSESTGSPLAASVSTAGPVQVALTRGKVANGDLVLARLIDGYWVAEIDGLDAGGTATLCVSVWGCCFPIAGVEVELRKADDTLIGTGFTSEGTQGGYYCWTGLANGTYKVRILGGLPALYENNPTRPDPQAVMLTGASGNVHYGIICAGGVEQGLLEPVAGYWCAGCNLGIPAPFHPQVKCGDPAPYPTTLTMGGHSATLTASGCPGYECRLWMGSFSWTGAGFGILNDGFDPASPPSIACPLSGHAGPYDVRDSTFFFIADKTGVLFAGPSCTVGGFDPVYGDDIGPAADVAGLTLCNVWGNIGWPYRTPIGYSAFVGGLASFYVPWTTAACSCDPLLLVGSWTPPVSYRPYWGAGPVAITLAP